MRKMIFVMLLVVLAIPQIVFGQENPRDWVMVGEYYWYAPNGRPPMVESTEIPHECNLLSDNMMEDFLAEWGERLTAGGYWAASSIDDLPTLYTNKLTATEVAIQNKGFVFCVSFDEIVETPAATLSPEDLIGETMVTETSDDKYFLTVVGYTDKVEEVMCEEGIVVDNETVAFDATWEFDNYDVWIKLPTILDERVYQLKGEGGEALVICAVVSPVTDEEKEEGWVEFDDTSLAILLPDTLEDRVFTYSEAMDFCYYQGSELIGFDEFHNNIDWITSNINFDSRSKIWIMINNTIVYSGNTPIYGYMTKSLDGSYRGFSYDDDREFTSYSVYPICIQH